MYTKDELMSKSFEALADIAKEMNVEYGKHATAEEISYAILDEQALQEGNKNPLGRHRTRTRVTKNSAVKVTGREARGGKNGKKAALSQGSLFSIMETEQDGDAGRTGDAGTETAAETVAAPVPEETDVPDVEGTLPAGEGTLPDAEDGGPEDGIADENPAGGLFSGEWTSPEEELAAIPKHRGRRTKREMELMALIKENKKRNAQDKVRDAAAGTLRPADSAGDGAEKAGEGAGEKTAGVTPDGVWEGDPGDGTDFIPVVDVPVEDAGAVETVDMFGNPYYNQGGVRDGAAEPEDAPSGPEYEFANLIECNGVLEVQGDGYGFLRSSDYNYLSSPDDVYVSHVVLKKYGLKTGDVVQGRVRPPKENEQYFTLTGLTMVNGREPAEIRDRIAFEHLTPLFPDEKFELCGDAATTNLSTRIVDLFSPIGKGQRALIVAQPKTGKTILMKNIANAIAANHPEAYLMMLLIDERPEEVTDMARTVNAEVIASTFDEPAERHVKIAGIVLEKAKRLVECGHDVVIFLDSITRLARAYNTVAPASGKVLTGGVDANALQKPKRFFGAARNIENGGSLTIIATALIDTGSKMDEVIFEEFKGTGNMELQLDRSLSNKRVFPSVNLVLSSTRRDELLQDEMTRNRMWILRNHIADMTAMEAMDTIRKTMEMTKDNAEFLASMNS